jgi:hypothetical protein
MMSSIVSFKNHALIHQIDWKTHFKNRSNVIDNCYLRSRIEETGPPDFLNIPGRKGLQLNF